MSSFDVGLEFSFELLDRNFVVSHNFEFFCKLDGLIEGAGTFNIFFDSLGPSLNSFFKLGVAMLVRIQLHVLASLDECSD